MLARGLGQDLSPIRRSLRSTPGSGPSQILARGSSGRPCTASRARRTASGRSLFDTCWAATEIDSEDSVCENGTTFRSWLQVSVGFGEALSPIEQGHQRLDRGDIRAAELNGPLVAVNGLFPFALQ